MRLEEIEDGLSKTLLASESREQKFGSWYGDSRLLDFVHEPLDLGVVGLIANNLADNPFPDTNGQIAAPTTSLNVGPKYNGDTSRYLGADPSLGFDIEIEWGPSSEHAGSVINHVFADGHVISVSETADPATYLRMITRNGGESVSEENLQ